MPKPRSSRKPTFLWQAVLIVLPVVVLVAFGLLAIRRDYATVEEEARRRAEGIARDLASRLASPVALERYAKKAGVEVGSEQSDLWVAYARQIAERRAFDPGRTMAVAILTPVTLSGSGELTWPVDYPVAPTPAAWLNELTAEQAKLWQAARVAESARRSAVETREAFQAFIESEPPAAAKVNADLALLTLSLEANPGGDSLVEFARGSDATPSESGLPLAAVALMRAFRGTESAGLNAVLFEELARQISAVPCLLTPQLLDAADRLAVGPPPHAKPAVEALRDRWCSQERLRSLARRARSLAPTLGLTSTNFWFDWGSQRWLASVKPVTAPTNDVVPHGFRSSRREEAPSEPQNPTIELRFLPKEAVEWVAHQDLAQAGVSIPDYFRVGLSLDGEPLRASPVDDRHRAPNRGDAAADATNQVRRVLARSENHQRTKARPNSEDSAPAPPAVPESVPSHLEIAVELGDPPRLYAQARQRALLFGSLILAAAATALVGLVTARSAFARQLRLNELKSNFVSSVSHELRAPIASVRLLAESLERGTVADPARQAEYFKLIVQECRRLGALITNVLDFSRIDQGRKQYEFEPTDLAALVRQTMQLMEPYATERQVTLALSPANLQPSTFNLQPVLDGRAIQQALVNLIDNAIQHAPAGTTVTVGLESEWTNAERGTRNAESRPPTSDLRPPISDLRPPTSDLRPPASDLRPPAPVVRGPSSDPRPPTSVLLWVEDSGAGIPPEEHEKIFEPFYRRGSELRRETQGVGIGLTIVKHVVEAHGGRVTVRSAVGQGSRFTIELPVHAIAKGETSSNPD